MKNETEEELRDKKEKTMEMGDVKAMREALEQASYFLHRHHMGAVYASDGETLIYCDDVAKIVDAALSTVPRKMKEVYAIRKMGHDAQDDSEWPDIELFESENDAIMVLSLEAGKHLDDQGFSWDGKELTWTSGNWSYNWWLEKLPVVESGTIVSDLKNIEIELKNGSVL